MCPMQYCKNIPRHARGKTERRAQPPLQVILPGLSADAAAEQQRCGKNQAFQPKQRRGPDQRPPAHRPPALLRQRRHQAALHATAKPSHEIVFRNSAFKVLFPLFGRRQTTPCPHGRTPYRGISVADQPAINLSTFSHLSTRSTCSTRLKLLVPIAEFATIIPNES